MSGPNERDEIAAVLGEHSWDMTDEVKVNGVWKLVLCCECGDQPRLTEGHQHIADAILASDWLAERDRRTAAEALRGIRRLAVRAYPKGLVPTSQVIADISEAIDRIERGQA